MNIAVRYYSRSGNTKKVAVAIADAVGVEAQDVSVPLTEKVDVLFLGNAMYAAGIDDAVKQFITENKNNIGMIYNVSTTAVASSTYKMVQKVAEENGVAIATEEFHCRGAFTIMHRNHPNEKDLQRAADFAKSILDKVK